MSEVVHSPMFNKINHWYNEVVPALWTKEMVANAVVKGAITEAEYADIVGEPYVPVESEATIQDYENGMRELGVL